MADITGFQRDRDGIFIVKDPSANIRFQLDWTDYLATNSDTIDSAAVTIETHTGDVAPLALPTNAGTDVSVSGGKKVVIRLNAGDSGQTYNIKVAVTLASNDIDVRHFRVLVKEDKLT